MAQLRYEKMVDIQDMLGNGIHMPAIVASAAEKMLGLSRLNKAYDKIQHDLKTGVEGNFFSLAVKHLKLKYKLRVGDLDKIPKTGAAIVVANHPHGMSDGIMFGDILTKIRPDVRLIVNEQLSLIKELEPWVIKVDVYAGEGATRKNYTGMKAMLSWLRKGGLIAIFPAGTASSYSRQDKQVTDDPWNEHIASLIRHTKATAVPVYFPGRNSLLFQGISLIKKEARVAFIPREVSRDSRHMHQIIIGTPVSGASLSQFDSDSSLVAHLRLRTYLLGKTYEKSRIHAPKKHKDKRQKLTPLIDAIPPAELQEELTALPESSHIVGTEDSNWHVYAASSAQIPKLLREIGRLREFTFRSVGEGTGLSCDLDPYDNHYMHLILWDQENKCVIGAYRMGLTDKILAEYGLKGLYNSQFFNFSTSTLSVLKQGMEMGRAFIIPDYQRRPLGLATLWEGIGQFMVRNPQYRYLYGTVSISREYTNLSRALIVSYLEAHEMDRDNAIGVKAICKPKKVRLRKAESQILPLGIVDSQNLSTLIADIEEDGKGIPILLRQYLKLNGKMLSFSLDKDFCDVLDCLILVDMYKAPERSLKRYFGKEGYKQLLALIEKSDAINS